MFRVVVKSYFINWHRQTNSVTNKYIFADRTINSVCLIFFNSLTTKRKNNVENDNTCYDILIVGQGLAGTCVAMAAMQRGLKVMVADAQFKGAASSVAAGLFNPITGKRFAKSWMYDELYQHLIPFYRSFEKLLNSKILFDIPIIRPLFTIEEANFIDGKSASEGFIEYLQTDSKQVLTIKGQALPYLQLNRGGFVKVPLLVRQFREFLTANQQYLHETIVLGQNCVQQTNGHWLYNHIEFRNVCVCVGFFENNVQMASSITPVKGEILIGKSTILNGKIWNNNGFLLPYEADTIWCGATYSWTTDATPTAEGRKELIEKAEKFLSPQEVVWINQIAGIRPATPERRPIYGKALNYDKVFYLNGLGSKGVALAPYFATRLVELITQEM